MIIQELVYFKGITRDFATFLGGDGWGIHCIVPYFKNLYNPTVDIPDWGEQGCTNSMIAYIMTSQPYEDLDAMKLSPVLREAFLNH